MNILIVLGALLFIFVVWVIAVYNNLVRLRNQIKNAFSQIDVQLKKRYDLIPNLVETAKAYIKHERETLENVIKARNTAQATEQDLSADPSNPSLMKKFLGAESGLGASLGQMRVTFEAYPDLKANATIQQLMEEITSTENKISFARQAFNDTVLFYNNDREVFPNSLVTRFFKFLKAEPFEIDSPQERQSVKVDFN